MTAQNFIFVFFLQPVAARYPSRFPITFPDFEILAVVHPPFLNTVEQDSICCSTTKNYTWKSLKQSLFPEKDPRLFSFLFFIPSCVLSPPASDPEIDHSTPWLQCIKEGWHTAVIYKIKCKEDLQRTWSFYAFVASVVQLPFIVWVPVYI